MIVVLLILHGLLAVALLGAITHQALAVLSTAPATNGRWNFFDRFRGVDATAYATPIVVLFAITTLGGALLYPQYRIDVRPALEDMQNSAANGRVRNQGAPRGDRVGTASCVLAVLAEAAGLGRRRATALPDVASRLPRLVELHRRARAEQHPGDAAMTVR
jgi:hypothetical protein